MFEKASRLKLRFESPRGLLTVEDLWELPLTSAKAANLDDIAKGLNRKIRDTDTESFVKPSPKVDEAVNLAFEIVKHIIQVKSTENEAAALERVNREKKQQILGIIARKKDEKLEGASLEELEAMANSL